MHETHETTATVPIGDCRLAVRLAGPERDAPPLLCVHAGVADSRQWEPQVAPFAQRHRVIRPDLRGHGATPKPPEPYANHADLAALLDHLGIERTPVVGASMGGAAALELCLEQPERVSALVLVCSALGGVASTDPWLLAKWEAADAAFEAGDLEGAARIELETWLAGPERALADQDPALVDALRTMILGSYALDAEAEEREVSPPACERLAEIRVPTLVLVGARDVPDMRAQSDLIAAGIAGAEMRVLADCAHLPNLERPGEFAELVLEFLERGPESR